VIVINGSRKVTFDESTLSELEQSLYHKKQTSPIENRYDSVHHLLFELHMRSHIIESSKGLCECGIHFADFKNSQCNKVYWQLTNNGRFQLNSDVDPKDAVRDIFINGDMYAFECSMAVIIVLYKALLDSVGPELFDVLFPDLLLFDHHSNSNLHLIVRNNIEGAMEGDVLYFENPEFDPLLPWWKGENAIMIGENLYFGHGHGLGIATAEEIISVLNKSRKPGSTKSTFLTDRFVHPDFAFFAPLQSSILAKHIIAKIGTLLSVR
jgi:protein-glutamine gamma-glutamyltransferase